MGLGFDGRLADPYKNYVAVSMRWGPLFYVSLYNNSPGTWGS